MAMRRALSPGLSEWAVHPGIDNAEYRALQPDGHCVRETAQGLAAAEGIVVLDYCTLQAAWNER
ncbi:MAG: hypothetical protein R2851_06140 [Caldilineaceae bacterium]